MEKIHLIPTDKPSRLYSKDGNHKLDNSTMAMDWYISSVGYKPHNIYITNDEEIKEGDWVIIDYTFSQQGLMLVKTTEISLSDVEHGQQLAFSSNGYFHELRFCKKIILTTDHDLIKDGVQSIDDEFLEWFVKNPSCEAVKFDLVSVNEFGSEITVNGYGFDKFIYKIIIPKEKLKQETLEEVAEKYIQSKNPQWTPYHRRSFIDGAKWQQERSYSEEDFKLFARQYYREIRLNKSNLLWDDLADKCFEQFKKK